MTKTKLAAEEAKATYLAHEKAFAEWLSSLATKPYSAIKSAEQTIEAKAQDLRKLRNAWRKAEKQAKVST